MVTFWIVFAFSAASNNRAGLITMGALSLQAAKSGRKPKKE
jgi:hypothetical protein